MTAQEVKYALYKTGLATCKSVNSDLVPANLALCYSFFEARMLQKRVDKLIFDRIGKGVKWSQLSSFSSRYVGAESQRDDKKAEVKQVEKDIVEIKFAIEKGGLPKRENKRLPSRLARKEDKLRKLQESLERAEIENKLMQTISAEVEAHKLKQKK